MQDCQPISVDKICIHRPSLLRQHRLRRPFRLLLRLAAPLAENRSSQSLRHPRRTEDRRTGRYTLPPRQQRKGGNILSGRDDGSAMRRLAEQAHPGYPVTIYYAFKQSETKGDTPALLSTGWETFLDAVIRAGLPLPVLGRLRTELGNRMRRTGTPTPSPPASSSSAANALPMHQWPPAANSSPR